MQSLQPDQCPEGQRLNSYWFECGTPTFLFEMMDHYATRELELYDMEVNQADFYTSQDSMVRHSPFFIRRVT